jgi:DNA-binding CsgD family transcriptional regulator
MSATPEAAASLDEVATHVYRTDLGIPMPIEAQAYAAKARAEARNDASQPLPRALLRRRTGVWLAVHGSVLQGTDQLALTVEPSKESDIAPLIVEAHGLTAREVEVTRLIARGLRTSQIEANLFLSPHTVRDHVKAVLEKVGVSSRASPSPRPSPTTTRRRDTSTDAGENDEGAPSRRRRPGRRAARGVTVASREWQ